MNSSDLTTTSPYLPGGTAALLLGEHISRIDASGRCGDPLGRWSYFTLRHKHLPPLTIFTVYKVNKLPTNSVGITAWHQQRIRLDEQHRHNEHPREAFTKDLIHAVSQHQAKQHHIIIGGDFNDTLFTPRSQHLRLASILRLTDPWTDFYPQHEDFNTYRRGSARINSLLISHDLIDSIRKIGYSPFNWLTTSDHRALLIDFDTTRLFNDNTDPLHSLQRRGLRSNDKQQLDTFICPELQVTNSL
jgi:hypothetical protein